MVETFKRGVASGATAILAGNMVNLAASVLAVKLMVRGLGSSGYGLYSRIVSPIFFLQPLILLLGERYYAFKKLSSHIAKRRFKEASDTAMFLLTSRILYGSLLTIAVYVARGALADYVGCPQLSWLLGLASLLILLNGMYEIGYSLSISEGMEAYAAVGSVSVNIVKILMLTAFLLSSKLEIRQVLISIIVGYVVGDTVLIALSSLKVKPKPINPRVYVGYFREMVSYSFPVVFQALSVSLCLELPPMLFAHVGPNIENAVLRVSNRYFKMIRMVGSALTVSMLPRIGAEESEKARLTIVSRSIPYFAYIGSLLSALAMSVSRSLLSLMSSSYMGYWAVLSVMSFSTVFLVFIPLRSLLVVDSNKNLIFIGLVQLLFTAVASYMMLSNVILLSTVYPLFYALYLSLTAVSLRKDVGYKYVFRYVLIGVFSTLPSAALGQALDYFLSGIQPLLPFYSLIVLILPFIVAIVFVVHANIYVYLGGLSLRQLASVYTSISMPQSFKVLVYSLLNRLVITERKKA